VLYGLGGPRKLPRGRPSGPPTEVPPSGVNRGVEPTRRVSGRVWPCRYLQPNSCVTGARCVSQQESDVSERGHPAWGAVTEAPVAAALGTSSFRYAEAYDRQDRRCLERGHIHSFEQIEGVPAITMPDRSEAGVAGGQVPFLQSAETKGLLRKV